jgi:RimJ/RimL family protein N-acetyltransferase
MSRVKTIFIFFLSFLKFSTIKKISELRSDGFVIRGCLKSEVNEVEKVYKILNDRFFSKSQRMLLTHFSDRILFVVIANDCGTPKIVGMNFYYINFRDFKEKTIHSGFIGILPEFEGRGIATKMRLAAIKHFKRSNFQGISSRISKNNKASLHLTKKVGYEPVEEYFDPVMNEDRCYLIRDLKG